MFNYFRYIAWVNLCMFACVSYAQTDVQDTTRYSDPTVPLGYERSLEGGINIGGEPLIKLNSILFGSERKIAIINGQPLRENQTIKGVGAKIKKIEVDAVTLQQGTKIWRVPLNKTVIRK